MSANKVSLTLKLTIFITSASTHISKALQNAAENTVADVGGGTKPLGETENQFFNIWPLLSS